MPRSWVGDEHSKPPPSGVRCGFGQGRAWADGEGGGGRRVPRRQVGASIVSLLRVGGGAALGGVRAWAEGGGKS